MRSRDRPCTCKTDLRGRGIVLLGILRWCHSTLGSSVCVRRTVAGGVVCFAKRPACFEGRVASLATAAGWSRGSLRQSRRHQQEK